MLATAGAAAPANGDAILDRVRAVWSAMAYPPLVDYDIVVDVTAGTSERRDRYHGEADPARDAFSVRPFSDAEERQPYVPRGTNLSYAISIRVPSGNAPVAGTGGGGLAIGGGGWIVHDAPVEPFAIPELSPFYSFGLRGCAVGSALTPQTGALKTIGSVTTTARRYRAMNAGLESVDGQPALHLTLTPLVDPQRDRVRDLWVDPATDVPLAARVAGNFTGRAEGAVPWLIRFITVAGVTAIDTELAEAPIRRGRTVFDRVVVHFDRVRANHAAAASVAFAIPSPSGLNAIEEPPDRTAACVSRAGE